MRSATNLGIGYNSAGPQAMRMLLQFNLSSIPTYATVNNATIYLYQYSASGVANMGFQAQYAVSPWNEYNATWNNANYIGGSPLPIGNFPSTLGWLSFNSTNLFRTWVSGDEPNYGLIVTGNEDPAANSSRYFYSSNAGGNRPYVDINYTTGCAYTTPPTSSVNSLPATSPNAFTVSWTGAAYTPPGCAANGISSYIVWYQVNNGGFIKWLDGVSYTSATVQRGQPWNRQRRAGRIPLASHRQLRQQDARRQCHGIDHDQCGQSDRGHDTAAHVDAIPPTSPSVGAGNPQGGPADHELQL